MDYTDKVELRKLQTADGLEVPSRRAVVNLTNNRVIGVVSPRYKLIHNETLLRTISPAIEELNLGTVKPIVNTTRGGAVTFFKFLGEKVQGEIQKGDIVRFGVEFFNSYDGSMPIGFHIIAERLVCINGLVVPKSITEIRIRHTHGADTGDIRDKLKEFFPKMATVIDLWKKWTEIQPSETVLEEFLARTTGRKLGEELMNRYRNLKEGQNNLWEFYNILTYYITHQVKTRKSELKAFRQFQMQETWTNRLTNLFERKERGHADSNSIL